ncbi:MAG TPA: hypothetical protein VM433_09730 [Mycobacteriales bacterium]|nr:hypothetical protein [Mycobacteriales bacterium]
MTRAKLALSALLLAAGAAVLAPPAVFGTTGLTPLSSTAAQDVRQRADSAAVVMGRSGGVDSAVEHARRVVGGTEERSIELMAAEGDGGRGHVVLRISSTFIDPSPLSNDSTATACYRYELDGRTGLRGPNEVRCPSTRPVELPPPPPEPEHPADADQRLATALSQPDPRRAVEAAFDLPLLTVETATVDGTVGSAVQASPGECLSGRRLPDGTVEVWWVPRIVAMPGELGCDAEAATDASSARSPH